MTAGLRAASATLRLARAADARALAELSPRDWDWIIRIARAANLLGAIAATLKAQGLFEQVPLAPRIHFEGAWVLSERQVIAVRWEARQIAQTLQRVPERLVLLKGAAYLAQGFEFASGRMFSDVDILVPDTRIAAVEQALMLGGWATEHHSEYDQRYYRRWMHEIPPMRHLERGTVIDVHHRILPRTSRFDPDPARMLAAARPARCWPDTFVLSHEDMILHSATHLYHEGETQNALRDLLDIDALIDLPGAEPGFWPRLSARAQELDLVLPLRRILQQAQRLLGTCVPIEARAALKLGERSRRVDWLYGHALQPLHWACDRRATPLARWLVYVRAHLMRMPAHLLAAHLARKAWRRAFDLDGDESTADA